MAVYKVEVHTATHDEVVAGRFDARRSVVRVEADSDVDAVLVACQLAHTTDPREGMPTYALLLDFPT